MNIVYPKDRKNTESFLNGYFYFRNVYQCLVQNYPSLFISSRSCSDSGLLVEQIGQTALKVPSPTQVPQANMLTSPIDNSVKVSEFSCENSCAKKGDIGQRKFPTAYLKDLRVHR